MRNSLYTLTLMALLGMSYLFLSFWSVMYLFSMMFFFLFFLKNQHLTISLIQLEVLGLASLLFLLISILVLEKEMVILFAVMVVIVVEASLGLSLVIKQARNLNKEFFKFTF